MSLSRPVKFPWLFCLTPTFPLLKLPWLCIKCVLHNSNLFDIIYFATISNRTRRIVKGSNYPQREIDVHLDTGRSICIEDGKTWYFMQDKYGNGGPIVLQKNGLSLCTQRHSDTGHLLHSYTSGDALDALKMSMNFLIDLFRCTIRNVFLGGNQLSELFGLDVSSVKVLNIGNDGPVNITDLKYLFESIRVTDEYLFYAPVPKDFHCDPHMVKCRKLYFGGGNSADWVTLEILCQFDVPRLIFSYHRFSKQDIVSYITHWLDSENRKLEYLSVWFKNPITLEDFKFDHLNPMPFCEKRRNRWSLYGSWKGEDMSSGMDILRKDGLLATFFVKPGSIIFHVWHKRFPDTA